MLKQQYLSMASCEICGIQILEKADRVYVEGNLLTVCKSCSKRGKPSSHQQNIQKTGNPSSYQQNIQKIGFHRPKKIVKTEKITFDDTRILVSNLSEVLRKSRMSRGLTHEQLGLSLNEREVARGDSSDCVRICKF